MSTIAGALEGVLLESSDTEIHSLAAEVQSQDTEVRILLGVADGPALRSTGPWKTALPHFGNEIGGGMGWGKNLHFFPTGSCKFQTDGMFAHNFNFAPKFPKIHNFCLKFCIFERKIMDKNFFDYPKFRGTLPATTAMIEIVQLDLN